MCPALLTELQPVKMRTIIISGHCWPSSNFVDSPEGVANIRSTTVLVTLSFDYSSSLSGHFLVIFAGWDFFLLYRPKIMVEGFIFPLSCRPCNMRGGKATIRMV